jgi:hypothetical protein
MKKEFTIKNTNKRKPFYTLSCAFMNQVESQKNLERLKENSTVVWISGKHRMKEDKQSREKEWIPLKIDKEKMLL